MEIEQTEGREDGSEALPVLRLGWIKAFFFLAAFLSFVVSVTLWFGGSREEGIFVGIWVPSILSAGALLLAGEVGGDA